ncbi:SDR family oxidoreductase, partial [Streptomyces nitrosporeus]|uniref:SDR family oxidoreductase n=1 Tax=Streptomyces nitrosporeus TaxID=28894 RepID=UPI00167E3A03
FVTFFVGQALLGSHSTSLGEPHVLRAVFGAALYLTMLCLFSAGVTTMLHNQTLALGVLVPFFFLLSPILSAVPKVKTLAHYFPDYAVYAATKAGLTQLSAALRTELGPRDVRVTNVEPGLTETELGGHIDNPELAEQLGGMFAAIPALTAEDVADLIGYTVSRRREVNL